MYPEQRNREFSPNPQSSHQQPSHKTIDQTITKMSHANNDKTASQGEAPPQSEPSNPNTSNLMSFPENSVGTDEFMEWAKREEVQRWWSGWAKRHNKKVRARTREKQLESLNNCLTECLSVLDKDVSEDPETAKLAERLSELQKQVDVISEDTKADTVQRKTPLQRDRIPLVAFLKASLRTCSLLLLICLFFIGS